MTVRLRCEGCGHEAPPLAVTPHPFRCPNAGDGRDHVLAPWLDPRGVAWPTSTERPFVRDRHLLHAHLAARVVGLGDEGYLAIEGRLHEALVRQEGRGFEALPVQRAALAPGHEVYVADATGQPGGSHKGRHLFGVLLHLEVVRAALGVTEGPLAIASCGNAALAAAVLARVGDRRLRVFVPEDVHPNVAARLGALGADVRICPRRPGETGDPTVAAFRAAVAAGAIPFACQGTECGLTLDGGRTLGFDLLRAAPPLDRVFVQVGGGALGSSLVRAFDDAVALGAIARAPRWMMVQGAAVAPLAALYARVVDAVRARTPHALPEDGDALADALLDEAVAPLVEAVIDEVVVDRGRWMPPWPTPAASVAHGILDDETYDGVALLRAMVRTGGSPVVVDEAGLLAAEAHARAVTSVDADATGTAGVAGLLAWARTEPAPERIAVLLTGTRR